MRSLFPESRCSIRIMVPWHAFLGIPVWDPGAPWPFAGGVPAVK